MPDKLKQSDVIVTKRRDGSYECAAIIGLYRVHNVYYGYTKREAVRLFIQANKGA